MERARIVQLVLAFALSGALLVETYALFDPDLGTPVPIFHEWTCRGDLEVVALDGFGRPDLRVPSSGLNATAKWEGEFVPAYFRAFHREAGGEWVELPAARDERGWHIFFLEKVTPATEAYVVGRDLSGLRCEGTSSVIGAVDDGLPPVVTPPLEPTPTVPPATPTVAEPTPTPPAFPDCADVRLVVVNAQGEPELTPPSTTLRATIEAPLPTGNAIFTLNLLRDGELTPVEERVAEGEAAFTFATDEQTRAFVHVDFRPAFECAKDSSVLRARSD